MSDFNFKKFVKTGSKLGNYSISFNGKSFSFGFNSGFYVKHGVSQFKKVVLYYDAAKTAVAFQFTNDEKAEGAFSVVHSKGKNKSSGSVTAKSFVIENNINNPIYFGRKTPVIIKDENLVELVVIKLLDENKQQS